MYRLILILFFSVLSYQVSAQTWEVGGFLGGSGYMGDINLVNPYKLTNPAFGLLFKRNFDSNWSAKISFMQGKVQANDASSSNSYQRDRNLNFRSPISELSIQVEFNLFRYAAGADFGYRTRKFSPYLFTGLAAFAFNPLTDDNNGREVELRPLMTENVAYKRNAISIPYGAGVKYNIGGNFTLIGEIGYRTTFTDYLDDISGTYIDFNPGGSVDPVNSLTKDLADRSVIKNLSGTQRGDGRKPRDTYIFSGLSLTYTFVPIKCPTF